MTTDAVPSMDAAVQTMRENWASECERNGITPELSAHLLNGGLLFGKMLGVYEMTKLLPDTQANAAAIEAFMTITQAEKAMLGY